MQKYIDLFFTLIQTLMKKAKLLLLTLLALIGYSGAQAGETVNNYAVDFNEVISTGDHQFAVSKDWKHIAQ